MAEVVIMPDPPDHQILIPRRTAQIHTVVLDAHRGRGIGNALARHAERLAAEKSAQIGPRRGQRVPSYTRRVSGARASGRGP